MTQPGPRFRPRDLVVAVIFGVVAILVIVLGWDIGNAPEGN